MSSTCTLYRQRGERDEQREREINVLRQCDIVHLHLHMQGHVYMNGDCKKDREENVKRKIPRAMCT